MAGPLLALTCEETFLEERQVMREGKAETLAEKKTASCPTAYFAPRTFKASATMQVESLHRGIYPIRLYRADLAMTGEFDWPEPAIGNGTYQRVWKHAYLVVFAAAAAACVALLTHYLRHPLGTLPRTAIFFGIFVGLYGSLYVLLKREDHALLLGSAMVFLLLAVVMIATRKLDWAAFPARTAGSRIPAAST